MFYLFIQNIHGALIYPLYFLTRRIISELLIVWWVMMDLLGPAVYRRKFSYRNLQA